MQNKVLIVGASGLVGTAAAISFARAGCQWLRRLGVAQNFRRCQHRICPHGFAGPRSLRCSMPEAQRCYSRSVYRGLRTSGICWWSDPNQIRTNGQMLENLLVSLTQSNRLHVMLQGTKAYGAMVGPVRVPARESQPGLNTQIFNKYRKILRDHAKRQDYTITYCDPDDRWS